MSSSFKVFRGFSLFYEEYIQPFDANAYLVIIAILTTLYYGWRSTEVQNIQSVWIWELPRFRRNNSVLVSIFNSRSSSPTHGTTLSAGQSPEETVNSTTTASDSAMNTNTVPPPLPTVEEAISDAYTVTEEHRIRAQLTINTLQENLDEIISDTIQDSVPQQIIRQMDGDDTELRHRPSTSAQARSLDADNSASTENCSNENSENEQISKTRSTTDTNATTITTTDNSEFTVKLKYLNDDVKAVKAKPNDVLQDFKS